jgi:hypothetical protein
MRQLNSASLIGAIFRSFEGEHEVRQGLDAMVLIDLVFTYFESLNLLFIDQRIV